jgi:hypothetical protein
MWDEDQVRWSEFRTMSGSSSIGSSWSQQTGRIRIVHTENPVDQTRYAYILFRQASRELETLGFWAGPVAATQVVSTRRCTNLSVGITRLHSCWDVF